MFGHHRQSILWATGYECYINVLHDAELAKHAKLIDIL